MTLTITTTFVIYLNPHFTLLKESNVIGELLAGVFDAVASTSMTVCAILLIYAAYSNGHIRLVILYLVVHMLVMLTNAAFLIRCVFVTTNAGIVYVVEMFFSLGIIEN